MATEKYGEMTCIRQPKELTDIAKINQALIHICHNISDLQYKIWYLLLQMISKGNIIKEEKEDWRYVVSRSKLDELLGYELSTRKLEEVLEALRSRSVKLNYFTKDKNPVIHGMGFISEYTITSKRLTFNLPSYIQNVINEDKSRFLFLFVDWNILNSFSSRYSTILYKLCKDYEKVGRTKYMPLDLFRNYLGLKPENHSRIGNLIAICIKPPIAEINKSKIADISIEVVYEKRGNKIIGLQFLITKKNVSHIQNTKYFHEHKTIEGDCKEICNNKDTSTTYENLSYEGVITENAKIAYLEKYSIEEIRASINAANNYIDGLRRKGQEEWGINQSGIYTKALNENWGASELAKERAKEEANREKQLEKLRRKELEQQQKLKERQKEEESLAVERALITSFEEKNSNEQCKIFENFISAQSNFIVKELKVAYDENGVDAYKKIPWVRGLLVGYLKNIWK